MNKRGFALKSFAVAAFSLLLIIWLIAALNNVEADSRQQKLAAVENSVVKGTVLCYSVEGAYPESLSYLIENYGISYDRSRYIVHYEYFGSNIRPVVTVIEI